MANDQEGEQFEIVSDFSPGLVTNVAHQLMPPGACVSISNLDIHEVHGELRTRYPKEKLGDLADNTVGGVIYSELQDDRVYVAHGDGTNTADLVSITINNGTVVTVDTNVVRYPTFGVDFKSSVFVSPVFKGGNAYLGKISDGGDTLTTINACTDPLEVTTYRNRIWTHTAGTRATIKWCEYGDETTWDGTGSVNVYPEDGDAFIGLVGCWQQLYVFKSQHIYMLRGEPNDGGDIGDLQIDRISNRVGAVSPQSIVVIGSEIWFLALDGIYVLRSGALTCISRHVQSEMRTITREYDGDANTGNTVFKVPCATAREGKYVLSCHTGAGNFLDTVYVVDRQRQTISSESINMTLPFMRPDATLGHERVYALKKAAADNDLYRRQITGADSYGNFTVQWKSKRFNHGAPHMYKMAQFAILILEQDGSATTQLSLTYVTDQGDTETITDVDNDEAAFFNIPRYKWIQFELTGTIDGAAVTPTVLRHLVMKFLVDPMRAET